MRCYQSEMMAYQMEEYTRQGCWEVLVKLFLHHTPKKGVFFIASGTIGTFGLCRPSNNPNKQNKPLYIGVGNICARPMFEAATLLNSGGN